MGKVVGNVIFDGEEYEIVSVSQGGYDLVQLEMQPKRTKGQN